MVSTTEEIHITCNTEYSLCYYCDTLRTILGNYSETKSICTHKNRLFRTTNYHFVFGSVLFLWFKIRWLLVCRVLLHCNVALHCMFINSVLHYLYVKYCICRVNAKIVEEKKKKKIK